MTQEKKSINLQVEGYGIILFCKGHGPYLEIFYVICILKTSSKGNQKAEYC